MFFFFFKRMWFFICDQIYVVTLGFADADFWRFAKTVRKTCIRITILGNNSKFSKPRVSGSYQTNS